MKSLRLFGLPVDLYRRVKGSSNLRKIAENSAWLLADKALRMGVGLVIWVWLARYLGAEQFGVYNYALAFVSLFGALTTLGLDSVVVRDIVRNPSAKGEILGTAFLLKMASGVVVVILTSSVIAAIRPDDLLMRWIVLIVALSVVFQATDTIDFWFQSQVRSKYSVYAKNGAFVLFAGVKIALILNGASLIAFAWAGFAEAMLGAFGLVVTYRLTGGHLSVWRARIKQATTLLRDSWPLIFSGTFVFVNMQIDKVMIGEISGTAEAGIYSAASRLSEIWYMIPVIVGASIAPILIAERSKSDSNYRQNLQKVYNFMSFSAISLAVLVTFIAAPIVAVIYSNEYSAASHMLAIHIWTSVFVFHTSIRSRALLIEDKQHFIAIFAFVTMVSNIVFNLLLIPKYGGVGASYASLFSWMLCVFVAPLLSVKTADSVKMFLLSLNPVYYWKKA